MAFKGDLKISIDWGLERNRGRKYICLFRFFSI